MKVALTPLDFARRSRLLYAKREAVVDGDLRYTYAQFFERCDRWSAALQKMAIKPGDRVAYIAPNTHAQLESFYAVPQIGAVLVPINYRLTAQDFTYIVNHSGARVLCVHGDYLDAIDGIRAELPKVEQFVALEGTKVGWLDYEAIVAASPTVFAPAAIDEDDLISINYTSGTTARPKGVMITHRNAYLNVLGTLAHFQMSPEDRYLWTLPMFHANGWTFVWTVTARGAAHICLRKVDAAAIFESVERENITTLCAAPTVLIGIANAPETARQGTAGRTVRLLTAGAPPAAATIELIEGGLGWHITHIYGLTETAPFILICEEQPEHRRLPLNERATVKARQGVELVSSGEIRVMDEAGTEVAHDGQTLGEICVRGNVVMKGYFRDPEETDKAVRDGWFHTGDAAVVHPDGYAEIRDRFKDIIISGGENISSVEVEGVLLRHDAVQEVSVVGMPHPKWGEAPHAFVVLRSGKTATAAELTQFARDRLAHFKTPQWFSFVGELPKTATGKIQKYVLRGGRSAIAKQ
ncbi:MAG TPA: long-chain-fatty-acid--CoA ligase [Stellaceae bacterium]|jgi:fatty-acyl-CoA synthase|nr:long-chain-fatty-acid--CoA ligase [Stellaceae bacterium]